MRIVSLGVVLSLACLVACSGDAGPDREVSSAGAAASSGSSSGKTGSEQGGSGPAARAGTGNDETGGSGSGRAGSAASGGQTSVGTPDAGGSGGRGGGSGSGSDGPRATVERPALPSGLLSHTTDGCVIAADDSLKCWQAPPFPNLDVFNVLAGPGPFDAVFVEQTMRPFPFRCAHLVAGGYACDSMGSWRAPAPGREYVQLSLGSDQSCGLLASGTVECWDEAGPVPAPQGTFVQLEAYWEMQCALRDDGSAVCRVGGGTFEDVPAARPLRQISVGVPLKCGLDLSRHVVCWGLVGDAKLPTATARQVEASSDVACALLDDGRIECFNHRNDLYGFQLPPADARFREISGSDYTMCGIAADSGEVWCWGRAMPYTRVMDREGNPVIARAP